ncbi:MAG: hypothetical protein J6K75_00065 [Erysipelotrichaceae bacterium]|nr:hypothetical protein [Erysipelotrichaceae bacterium]
MKIQIVNLVPLSYPYQVTRMRKKQSHLEMDYSIQHENGIDQSDVYILIMKQMDDSLKQWIDRVNLPKDKIIYIAPEKVCDGIFWCAAKAFEKEFDAELLMTYLGCILNENPKVNLFQSLELKTVKVHRDPNLRLNLDHIIKGSAEVHLLIKDKVRRVYQIETQYSNVRIVQHWQKGVEADIDVLLVKRKS